MFRDIRWDERRLVAQGADVELLERGRLFEALRSASAWSGRRRSGLLPEVTRVIATAEQAFAAPSRTSPTTRYAR